LLIFNSTFWPWLSLFVPLALYLWNRRPGREVAVGSLRWLAAGANRRLRRLRPEQLLLLLLRAALLAVLAGALADPAWRVPRPAGRGQVLISPALADGRTLAALRPVLDSLRRLGYARRWLATGLPVIDPTDWAADSLGTSRKQLTDSISAGEFYPARVRLAADSFPGQPLFVLTPGALPGFAGGRESLPTGVSWRTVPGRAPRTWLYAATTEADSLRLLLATSDARQTTLRTRRVARPRPGAELLVAGQRLRYEAANKPARLRPVFTADSGRRRDTAAVPVPVGQLRAWVCVGPGRATEARYLSAALRAAALGLPSRLMLIVSPNAPPGGPAADLTASPNAPFADPAASPAVVPDWLFWLRDEPVPAAWRGRVRQGLRLWQEATGPGRADTTVLAGPAGAGGEQGEAIVISRRGPVALESGSDLASEAGAGASKKPAGSLAGASAATLAETIWADARGRAVLSRRAEGAGARYFLCTRFDPNWSSLADSPDLPARLLDVLAPVPEIDPSLAAPDQRQLDPAQLPGQLTPRVATQLPKPGTVAGAARAAQPLPPTRQTHELRPWLVLLAALLFGLERALAGRQVARASFLAPS